MFRCLSIAFSIILSFQHTVSGFVFLYAFHRLGSFNKTSNALLEKYRQNDTSITMQKVTTLSQGNLVIFVVSRHMVDKRTWMSLEDIGVHFVGRWCCCKVLLSGIRLPVSCWSVVCTLGVDVGPVGCYRGMLPFGCCAFFFVLCGFYPDEIFS